MRRRNRFVGFAAASLLAVGALSPALATDKDHIPPPAPDSPDERPFDEPNPGREAGLHLTQLLTGGAEKPIDGRLPSLDAGIIGVTGDPEVGYTVILGTDAPPATVASLLVAGLSIEAQQKIHVQVGKLAASSLQTAWLNVNKTAPELMSGNGAYWLDVDPDLQQIVVGVDGSMVSRSTGAAIQAIAPGLVHVLYEGPGGRAIRTTGDAAPHWGAAIISPSGYSYTEAYCSAGFTVKRTSDNVRTSVTAAHCGLEFGGNGGDWHSRSHFYGTVQGISGYPDYDQARLQGSTYNPYIYTDGGDDGQDLRSVRGATDPVVGDMVCQSGVTSEAECDIRIGSVTATYCDDPVNMTGCSTVLASGRRADDTVVIRQGDSGGPVYERFSGAEAGIRGMGIAFYDGGRRMFAERYDSIANHLNVQIVVAP